MSLKKAKKHLIALLGNADNKVIALAGRWGTGKTHLWNEVKEKFEGTQVRKTLYVSLFGLSSIDQVKRKLIEGALLDSVVSGGKLKTIKKVLTCSVNAVATRYKVLATINDLNLLVLGPLLLRDRVMVLDDIERKHQNLGIDEVLGFIDEYSKEFDARFVLILNDDQLASKDDQQGLWTTLREKVIDQEINLATTPDEAFHIAMEHSASIKYETELKKSILACGLTNIRIIKKIINITNQVIEDKELSASIQARIVPSIVLFSAIHHRGLEDGPDFQFALNFTSMDWVTRCHEKKENPTDEEVRMEKWRILMSELGISSCGDFEKVLVEFLESGLFESSRVQAIIDQYIRETKTIEAEQCAQTFIRKAIWDHRVTEADLVTEAAAFPASAAQLDPYVATELHGILSELDNGQDLANEVIDAWIAALPVSARPAPDDHNGTPLHPKIQAALDAAVAQQQAQATVVEACNHIFDHNGWGTHQEMVMKRATAISFESAIREMEIEDLPRFMRRMLRMRLDRSTYDPHFGDATSNFVEACRKIANDKNTESVRLAKLIRRLFAKTVLASEIQPTQSGPVH